MRSDTNTAVHSVCNKERTALATDALRQSGHLRLCVYGESMLPFLWPGDIVEIATCSSAELRAGEIVLAQRDGQFFLHRLIGAVSKEEGFVLRGDSMPAPDPVFPREALLGRVAGYQPTGFDARRCRLLGMLFCHSALTRRLALKFHDRRKKSAAEFADTKPAELGA